MADREKVLKALSVCMPETENEGNQTCADCPYWSSCREGGVHIPVKLLEDIRTILKAETKTAPDREKVIKEFEWSLKTSCVEEIGVIVPQDTVRDAFALLRLADAPTIDAIPIDWMLQRMNETASGAGLNVELNNALFTVGVEWERWKKEHAAD